MVFYAAFNSITVISRRQLTLFMLSWDSPVLGWALKCLVQGHSHERTQKIQCGSNPELLDYESNTLPLSRAGPYIIFDKVKGELNLLYINVNALLVSVRKSLKFVIWKRVNPTTHQKIYMI